MRRALIALMLLAAIGWSAALIWPREAHLLWQIVSTRLMLPAPPIAPPDRPADPAIAPMIAAAEAQVGVTRFYDPAYVTIRYPGGDVPRETGVCTDVVIRALRDGLGGDLQRAMRRDMGRAFAEYPKIWGLSRPDPNIDHRRVPNLETLLRRMGAAIPVPADLSTLQPGDIVTSGSAGRPPHIMLVTARVARDGTPLVAHNAGAGTRVENALPFFPPRGVFRLNDTSLARLRGLDR